MHRELHPHLFANPSTSAESAQSLASHSTQAAPGTTPGSLPAAPKVAFQPNELKGLEHQLNVLKMAIHQLEKRTEGINSKIDELGRGVHARLERFSTAIIRLDDQMQKQNQENVEKFSQVAAKVNERKVTDGKIHELVDRHNTIVRNFENRLTSLQRLTTEQEMTLHNAHAALDEVRLELNRRR